MTSRSKSSLQLEDFLKSSLSEFPWMLRFRHWDDASYDVGKGEKHWRGTDFNIHFKTEDAGKKVLGMKPLQFMEKFLTEEIDFSDNFYLLHAVGDYLKPKLTGMEILTQMVLNSSFQNISRAKVSIKSHYDIPQEVLDIYLDKKYLSYSCGMFENPDDLDYEALVKVGKGEKDNFDSLEKAQWRKFKDAIDYINPATGDTVLDVGCGYGGQLHVALENYDLKKVVGWTHSHNQTVKGRKSLAEFATDRWELNEGDYREDKRVYDHITSTGMISHVGPKGLIPYVKEIRRRIKKGGRYLHHSLMIPKHRQPMFKYPGHVFNRKYVWPGFHWFTIGDHVKALEANGFEVQRMVNLSRHYAKTTIGWTERMFQQEEVMRKYLGESTYRAWQIYLANCSGAFLSHNVYVYRLYCEAL